MRKFIYVKRKLHIRRKLKIEKARESTNLKKDWKTKSQRCCKLYNSNQMRKEERF